MMSGKKRVWWSDGPICKVVHQPGPITDFIPTLRRWRRNGLPVSTPRMAVTFINATYPADLVYLGDDQQAYKDLGNTSATGGRVYDLQTNKSRMITPAS